MICLNPERVSQLDVFIERLLDNTAEAAVKVIQDGRDHNLNETEVKALTITSVKITAMAIAVSVIEEKGFETTEEYLRELANEMIRHCELLIESKT